VAAAPLCGSGFGRRQPWRLRLWPVARLLRLAAALSVVASVAVSVLAARCRAPDLVPLPMGLGRAPHVWVPSGGGGQGLVGQDLGAR
jgi:hypothetical protein